MTRHGARRRRRRGGTSDVTGALALAAGMSQDPFEIRLDEGPGPHVLRLFLTPDHVGLLEARQAGDQRLEWQRIELFDAQQIDIVDAALLAFLIEIVIDLAGAQDDAADLVVLDSLIASPDSVSA